MVVYTQQAVEITAAFRDLLNEVCKEKGGIEHDNEDIWRVMHGMNNAIWDDVITTLENLITEDPSSALPSDQQVIAKARLALNKSMIKDKDFVGIPKVVSSGNKRTAWQTAMAVREVFNRHYGVHIPNRPGSVVTTPSPTRFDNLFSS
jgi:hypothetical protein